MKDENPRQPEKWVLLKHKKKTFMPWFKAEVLKDSITSEILIWLANGLKFDVLCCIDYKINDCSFYMKSLDEEKYNSK